MSFDKLGEDSGTQPVLETGFDSSSNSQNNLKNFLDKQVLSKLTELQYRLVSYRSFVEIIIKSRSLQKKVSIITPGFKSFLTQNRGFRDEGEFASRLQSLSRYLIHNGIINIHEMFTEITGLPKVNYDTADLSFIEDNILNCYSDYQKYINFLYSNSDALELPARKEFTDAGTSMEALEEISLFLMQIIEDNYEYLGFLDPDKRFLLLSDNYNTISKLFTSLSSHDGGDMKLEIFCDIFEMLVSMHKTKQGVLQGLNLDELYSDKMSPEQPKPNLPVSSLIKTTPSTMISVLETPELDLEELRLEIEDIMTYFQEESDEHIKLSLLLKIRDPYRLQNEFNSLMNERSFYRSLEKERESQEEMKYILNRGKEILFTRVSYEDIFKVYKGDTGKESIDIFCMILGKISPDYYDDWIDSYLLSSLTNNTPFKIEGMKRVYELISFFANHDIQVFRSIDKLTLNSYNASNGILDEILEEFSDYQTDNSNKRPMKQFIMRALKHGKLKGLDENGTKISQISSVEKFMKQYPSAY